VNIGPAENKSRQGCRKCRGVEITWFVCKSKPGLEFKLAHELGVPLIIDPSAATGMNGHLRDWGLRA